MLDQGTSWYRTPLGMDQRWKHLIARPLLGEGMSLCLEEGVFHCQTPHAKGEHIMGNILSASHNAGLAMRCSHC